MVKRLVSLRAVSMSVMLALLLVSCERDIEGDELVSQAERILSAATPGCAIDVASGGIGEGDADHAYAIIRLETGPPGDRQSKDVEVLVSDFESDYWRIQQHGSTQLVDSAIQLCKR